MAPDKPRAPKVVSARKLDGVFAILRDIIDSMRGLTDAERKRLNDKLQDIRQ